MHPLFNWLSYSANQSGVDSVLCPIECCCQIDLRFRSITQGFWNFSHAQPAAWITLPQLAALPHIPLEFNLVFRRRSPTN